VPGIYKSGNNHHGNALEISVDRMQAQGLGFMRFSGYFSWKLELEGSASNEVTKSLPRRTHGFICTLDFAL